MDRFDKEKQDCLAKMDSIDKSRKGSIDKQVRDLINAINGLREHYTTSSCAGRILLIEKQSQRKDEARWLLSTHEPSTVRALLDALRDARGTVWFKMEGAILHVACKDVTAAMALVDKAKRAGFKRSGIMAVSKRVMVELINTENIEMPLTREGELLVSEAYLTFLVSLANEKMERNAQKREAFLRMLK